MGAAGPLPRVSAAGGAKVGDAARPRARYRYATIPATATAATAMKIGVRLGASTGGVRAISALRPATVASPGSSSGFRKLTSSRPAFLLSDAEDGVASAAGTRASDPEGGVIEEGTMPPLGVIIVDSISSTGRTAVGYCPEDPASSRWTFSRSCFKASIDA